MLMSRRLFVGSYWQITWWALRQWKVRKNALNDNKVYLHLSLLQCSHVDVDRDVSTVYY